MAEEPGNAPNDQPSLAARRAQAAWKQLGMRVRAVTPSGLVHFALIASALGTVGWLIHASWPAMLPFVAGAVVAYAVVPVVEALEHVMPRVLAALLTVTGVFLFIAVFLALVLPPIARELYGVYQSIPSADDVARYRVQLSGHISAFPAPVRDFVNAEVDTVTANVRANLNVYLSRLLSITTAAILRVVQAVSVFLGLFVIPTWLLAVLKDRRTMRRAVGRVIPAWMAPDFWAMVRLLDRTLSAFVRGQLVLGLIVGGMTWATLFAFDSGRTGGTYGRYSVIMAMIAGILQLVPAIGPIVNMIVGGLIGLTISRTAGMLIPVVYLAIQLVVGRFIAPRFAKRVIDLHPAILVMSIVALSRFGFLWTLIAAPLVAITRDLFRYTYGRLSDPPRPAGLLPGEEPVAKPRPMRVMPIGTGMATDPRNRRTRITRSR